MTQWPNPSFQRTVKKLRFLPSAEFTRSRALCARERGASVEHRGVGRTAPANPSFERTPLRGFARVSLRALRALRPYAGAAQLAPR